MKYNKIEDLTQLVQILNIVLNLTKTDSVTECSCKVDGHIFSVNLQTSAM